MAKLIARRNRAVGPLRLAVGLHELPASRQERRVLFHGLDPLLGPGGHRRRRKLQPHDTGRLQELLRFRGELFELLLHELPQALRHGDADGGDPP